MYVFKADKEQLLSFFAKAFQASEPVGFGKFQYKPDDEFTMDTLDCIEANGVEGYTADYVLGRMMKISLRRNKEGLWALNPFARSEDKPLPEYQSFAGTYPTWESLFNVSGIGEFQIIDELTF